MTCLHNEEIQLSATYFFGRNNCESRLGCNGDVLRLGFLLTLERATNGLDRVAS